MVADSAQEEADVEEQALWTQARKERSGDAREALFAAHMEFAKRIAARHYRRRGEADVEFQELCQLAYAGLLEAIDRYDPARGVPFRGYASRRITGSILNGLAKFSEVREQVSYRNRVRAERLRSLSAELGDVEAADALQALTDMAVGLAMGFMLEGSGLIVAEDEADKRPSAYESLAWKELLRRLAAALEDLPERQRLIVRRHYQDGVDFTQLAAVLGLSKGRVSQLHRAAIDALRRHLSHSGRFSLER